MLDILSSQIVDSIELPSTEPMVIGNHTLEHVYPLISARTLHIAGALPPFNLVDVPNYTFEREVEALLQDIMDVRATLPEAAKDEFKRRVDDLLGLWDDVPYFHNLPDARAKIHARIEACVVASTTCDPSWSKKLDMTTHMQCRSFGLRVLLQTLASADGNSMDWRLEDAHNERRAVILHHLMTCHDDTPCLCKVTHTPHKVEACCCFL
ncbi:hypothetical protein DFP72DRAFT_856876 [Ephemerocybe angulata]|uniref:Uncharacterized protein n=1 Tax=Ephemerocybe angulata TaxID=980116 RepID=A0A8H6HFU1_9AGAR|nr:hypothetical protein DFP72DRAFT_856876 [Tulosesus angulatus]